LKRKKKKKLLNLDGILKDRHKATKNIFKELVSAACILNTPKGLSGTL